MDQKLKELVGVINQCSESEDGGENDYNLNKMSQVPIEAWLQIKGMATDVSTEFTEVIFPQQRSLFEFLQQDCLKWRRRCTKLQAKLKL